MEPPARYEVSVSDELRHLILRRVRTCYGRRVEGASPGAEAAHVPTARGALGEVTPAWQPMCLRRDGARPLRFVGLEVFRVSIGGTTPVRADADGRDGYQSFAAFFSEPDACIGHLTVLPPAHLPARPVYRASVLRNGDDARTLIRQAGPDAVLLDTAGAGSKGSQAAALERLCAQSDQLAAAAAVLIRNAA